MKPIKRVALITGILTSAAGLGMFFAAFGVNGFRSCGNGYDRFGNYQQAPPCVHVTGLLTTLGIILCPSGLLLVSVVLSVMGSRRRASRRSQPTTADDQPDDLFA